jgi:hypothetical protein
VSQVLLLQHPVNMVRDTSRYRPFMRPHGKDGGKLRPRKLRELAKEVLGMEIQDGTHDSVGGVGCGRVWGAGRAGGVGAPS